MCTLCLYVELFVFQDCLSLMISQDHFNVQDTEETKTSKKKNY